jgi:hypothetical protein
MAACSQSQSDTGGQRDALNQQLQTYGKQAADNNCTDTCSGERTAWCNQYCGKNGYYCNGGWNNKGDCGGWWYCGGMCNCNTIRCNMMNACIQLNTLQCNQMHACPMTANMPCVAADCNR